MTTGEKIRELREALGLSQNKFAEVIGVTQSAISRYEAGNRYPTVRVCYRMLGVAARDGAGHVASNLEDLLPISILMSEIDARC